MHVKSLKVFCDIVTQRSFSRAALDNGITQPGASQVVHQLEDRLGVKLIDRSKRPWVLTPEGDAYYQGVSKFVREYYSLEDKVRRLHREVADRVRVASIYSVGLSHMNQCVRDFMAKFPGANVHVQYQHPHQIYSLVERDAVDFGLVSYARESRTIQTIPWREERMLLACAPQNRLAQLATIRIEQLDGVNMVGFDPGLQIRQTIDRTLAEHGIGVQVVLEFDNIETIKRAIEIDAGVGLLPEPTFEREVEAGSLVAVSLATESPQSALVRPLAIICRQGRLLSATAERFLDELKSMPHQSLSAARRPELHPDPCQRVAG